MKSFISSFPRKQEPRSEGTAGCPCAPAAAGVMAWLLTGKQMRSGLAFKTAVFTAVLGLLAATASGAEEEAPKRGGILT